jgi:hypothetical protein
MVLAFFCWEIFIRVPTSILPVEMCLFHIWTNLGNLVQ